MIKSNLHGAAGVQINIRDLSARTNASFSSYRIALVGWSPRGPSNVPFIVRSENELYSIFGNPKGYRENEVYLLHNAKIILGAGAEVAIVRTVQGDEESETLNYGVYTVGETPEIRSPHSSHPAVAISNNMDVVISSKKNIQITPSSASDSPFTVFMKYPGFDNYLVSIQTFESSIEPWYVDGNVSVNLDNLFENTHTMNSVLSEYSNVDRLAFSSYVQGLGLYEPVYANVDIEDIVFLEPNSTGTTFPKHDGTSIVGNSPTVTRFNRTTPTIPTESNGVVICFKKKGENVYYSWDEVRLSGDAFSNGIFFRLNGFLARDWIHGLLSGTHIVENLTDNKDLNDFLRKFLIIRLYESANAQTYTEILYATIDDYVTTNGDQLDISSINSNLLAFKRGRYTGSLVDKSVTRTRLSGGRTVRYRRDSQALASAWGLFADSTTVDLSLLVDGGSSIIRFGEDVDNNGIEDGDITVVSAMLSTSSKRMDAPSIIDVPKRADVNDLVSYFKKYPSIGNEASGSVAQYATFWGNAQDGRQIVSDTFNRRRVEVARSVFKALVAFNVYSFSHPWQTQWGPNRGLITHPSIGTINIRKYPDEVGLLSRNRINPSRVTSIGEYFWDDYTMMAKSSVLQRWHAVCFLADINKRHRRMLEQYVAELNTPVLRKTITNLLTNDLNFIMNHANPPGLYNFYVICDETNNTPDVIDRGILNVNTGLEIVRDTRVINLTTTLYRTGGIIESNLTF